MARRFAGSPGAQLIVGGVILALAFPTHVAGAIGMAVLGGAVGIAAVVAWPHAPAWLRRPPAEVASTLVVAIVALVGVAVFRGALTESPDWQMGDWGPQRAVLAHVMPWLPGLDVPVWNQVVATGDAPLELYPSLAYLLTGHVALVLGLEHDLPLALMIVAVTVHIAIAVATAVVAMQIAPRPLALVVGVLMLVDGGAVAHGGTVGLFRWALLHSALALACSTLSACGILAALTRPSLAVAVAIWITTAAAVIAHPAGLIATAASMVALGAVALLASDVPPRRAIVALGHVALGVALGAALWMPLAERILAYGQHYPNPLRSPSHLLEDLLAQPWPVTAFAAFEYLGYAGMIAGLWSRRGVAVFVAATAFVLLLGLCDAPYVALDLAPGPGVARLGTERLAQLARPFVWAASAYGLAVFVEHARAGWRAATPARQRIAAAVLGIVACATLRAVPSVWASASDRAAGQARVFAPDRVGRRALEHWAVARVHDLAPGAWARALFEQDTHEHFHLTAETGLPSFHMSAEPDLLLRERMEDTSPESLRRFNVRWVIGVGKSPSLGDPATERQLGSYHIREVAAWDGKFARIERGTGEVVVTRLDDRAVEVDVTGTTEPVLVALGTGFYPRWRARHASGAAEPVYAYPTVPGGALHVVAAWLAPGHTTFTIDGPLPSDHAGRAISWAAGLAIVVVLAVWCRRAWRYRVLRRWAAARRRGGAKARLAIRAGVPLVVAALFVRGCRDELTKTRALALGSGLRSAAEVEARVGGGAWRSCGYVALTGSFECDGVLTAYDSMTSLINDAEPSWAFNTPGIAAVALVDDVELRIRLRARLAGNYHAAVNEGHAELVRAGDPVRTIDRSELVRMVDRGETAVEIRAKVPTSIWAFTFVRETTVDPPRPFLRGPPDVPPAALRAVRGSGAP